MNYSAIYYDDTVNGNGIRVSLFCSGCKRRCCPKCHNKKAWDFNYGNKFTEIEEDSILDYLSKPYVTGISILGGEPMDNLDDGILINLVKNIKNKYPNKTIYVWSGYTYEELILDENGKEFLKYIDMLRDGIGLRAYGQKDPLIEYKREAYDLFNNMMYEIQSETVKYLYRTRFGVQIVNRDDIINTQLSQAAQAFQTPSEESEPVTSPVHHGDKIGRNDPCPCGSGKKYKNCCGKDM